MAEDPSASVLRLRLGQIHLREHLGRHATNRVAPAGIESNAGLLRAVAELEKAAALNPPPEVRGTVALTLAWCRWEEAIATQSKTAMSQALTGFQAAMGLLPAGSADWLVARYKACLLYTTDPADQYKGREFWRYPPVDKTQKTEDTEIQRNQ